MSGQPTLPVEIERLEQIDLFQDLPRPDLLSICQTVRRVTVKRGDLFFHQGDPATVLYVLIEGQVKMTQTGPDGHQVIVRMVDPGKDFGAITALMDTLYPLAAQAVVKSAALAWDKETATTWLSAYPPITKNALSLVIARFKQLQERYRELATERVEQRVARTLLRLAQQAGRKTEQGLVLEISLSRQDLAEMAGTTLYSASRILSEWERQGIVLAGRTKVTICHLSMLSAVAEALPPG